MEFILEYADYVVAFDFCRIQRVLLEVRLHEFSKEKFDKYYIYTSDFCNCILWIYLYADAFDQRVRTGNGQ